MKEIAESLKGSAPFCGKFKSVYTVLTAEGRVILLFLWLWNLEYSYIREEENKRSDTWTWPLPKKHVLGRVRTRIERPARQDSYKVQNDPSGRTSFLALESIFYIHTLIHYRRSPPKLAFGAKLVMNKAKESLRLKWGKKVCIPILLTFSWTFLPFLITRMCLGGGVRQLKSSGSSTIVVSFPFSISSISFCDSVLRVLLLVQGTTCNILLQALFMSAIEISGFNSAPLRARADELSSFQGISFSGGGGWICSLESLKDPFFTAVDQSLRAFICLH